MTDNLTALSGIVKGHTSMQWFQVGPGSLPTDLNPFMMDNLLVPLQGCLDISTLEPDFGTTKLTDDSSSMTSAQQPHLMTLPSV